MLEQAESFVEEILYALALYQGDMGMQFWATASDSELLESIYSALLMGLRDYNKEQVS